MKEKIGLALGSGAARGLAHIGVLKVLEREGIRPDVVAGSSMGALVGALYARDRNIGRIEELALEVDWKKVVLLIDPTLPRTGFIEGRKAKDLLKSIIGDMEFSELGLPFACVTADIESGEEVVIEDGPVVEAVRASVSIPVIFTPVKRKGRFLVDGGLVNPIPVSVVRRMGAGFIIAVNVIPDVRQRRHEPEREGPEKEYSTPPHLNHITDKIEELTEDTRKKTEVLGKIPRLLKERKVEKFEAPSIFSVIMQTVHIAMYQGVESSLDGADLVIEPHVAYLGAADFHRAREYISEGERAAEEALLSRKGAQSPGH
jgi:NTE family protein